MSGAGLDAVRDGYLAAKARHIRAIEMARESVVHGIATPAQAALVDIDETMRSVLTDDR